MTRDLFAWILYILWVLLWGWGRWPLGRQSGGDVLLVVIIGVILWIVCGPIVR
jgi:hypothetical protein